MQTFILAILHEWHVFSQTKLVTIFKNVFTLYNNQLDTSFNELATIYGLDSPHRDITLYNDLNNTKKSPNVLYLHDCTIYKSQIEVFLKGLEDKEYTYKDAFNTLQALYDLNSAVSITESILKERNMASCVAKRGGDWGTDPDECVIYHSEN